MGLVTADISVSLDLVAAGRDQSLEYPFGPVGGERLHDWMATWMFDHGDDNSEEVAGILGAGAFVMGRHMFGPDRGEWDLGWQGWWGPEPPYHAPVFVLCSRPRESLTMAGGTTFHFETEGVQAALERARDASGDGDVAIAGGPRTLNAYLAAGLVDELRLHIAPFTLGDGLRVFDGVQGLVMVPALSRTTPHVTHLTYRRS